MSGFQIKESWIVAGSGARQTHVVSPAGNNYCVSSVVNGPNPYADETLIFPANEKGSTDDLEYLIEVYAAYPNQHEETLLLLEKGFLTEDLFQVAI